jgi:hypothetical protein
MKVVLGLLAVGIFFGFLRNLAYHEPWSWVGFALGLLAGLFGLFLYSRLDTPNIS